MKLRLVVLAVLMGAVTVGAQTLVKANQGAPGNQGAWPVTLSGAAVTANVAFDGGFIGTTAPVACAKTIQDGGAAHQIVQMGVAALQVPTTPSAGRIYVNVCNDAFNTSSIIIKCRGDGTAPVYAATGAGDVLQLGDCVTYTTPATANAVQCISNIDAGNYATSYECVPN